MNKLLRLTAALLVCFLWIASAGRILAQTAGQRGITIIPPKFELFANPGDQLTESLRVRNESVSPITYQILVEDFSTSGEEGQVILEEEQ
jgi:P pilus assembly chaperone PapD